MKRSIKSVAALAVATLAAAGVALVGAPAANAANGIPLVINPATGVVSSTPSLSFAGGCPATANRFRAWIYGGPNNWADNSILILSATTYTAGTTSVGVSRSMLDASTDPGVPAFVGNLDATGNPLAGAAGTPYSIRLECTQGVTSTVVDSFTAQFNVRTAGTAAVVTDTYAYVDSTPQSTLTQPVVTPSTGLIANSTSVTVSTSLSAPLAAGVTATGKVQFKAGAANLGAAQNVSLTGPTSVPVSVPGVQFPSSGTNIPVTAVFTPDSTTVVKSATSVATNVNVSGPAANTSTTLAPASSTIDELSTVTLTATVANLNTPAGATSGTPTGSVTFNNGATSIGSAPINASGVATLTVAGSTLGVGGPYNITASYPGASSGGVATFNASTSSAASVTVTAAATLFNPQPSPQTIQTNVVAGTITVTGGVTAASGAVTLGFPNINDGGVTKYALQLNAGNTLLTNDGAAFADGKNQLYRVFVTDSRAGNTGYKVTGTVAQDFSSAAGNKIDSALLGWTPVVDGACAAGQNPTVPTFTAGTGPTGSGYETVVAGGVYCTQAAVTATPGAVVPTGTAGTVSGLKAGGTLFSTTAGSSTGTVSAYAKLLLKAPTSTKAGYYSTQLSLTALSN